ncbi:MAG: hypothetical protein JSS27_12030 [Planctomycetes bacterium]|nr:hypothetical protein [Planctomycetota bacterium]
MTLSGDHRPSTTPHRRLRTCAHAWLLVALLTSCCGAGCPRWLNKQAVAPPPRVLPVSPTLDDVTRVVNENTGRVQSLAANDASIRVPMTPALRANLNWQRARNLRLRAETSLSGPELDVGSNDQIFWFWVRRMDPPAVLFCRHEQYFQSAAPRMLPVQPDWIPEALGLVVFEPDAQHTGPFPTADGKLEIRTARQGPQGVQTKVTVVDASTGWVLQQNLYDGGGRLIASSTTSQHERDPSSGAVLPRRVEISVPSHQFSMRLDLRTVQVNVPVANQLFDLPAYPNANLVDLTDPSLNAPINRAEAAVAPTVGVWR